MSIKHNNPIIAYHVTHMDHSEQAYNAHQFYENISDDNFLKDMQCFNRYLTYRGVKDEPVFLDQTPCLIVQQIIEKKPYDNGEELSAYFEELDAQSYYCQNKVMLTYQDMIEPIAPTWIIFDRNMELLSPDREQTRQAGLRFANSEMISRQLSAAQSSQSVVLN
jgi:hypothetical protein